MNTTPNFNGWNAVILHRQDEGIERLVRQLTRLNLSVHVQWEPFSICAGKTDLVLVDADQGWDGLLPWSGHDAPVPLIALLASEAPGRIAWAMKHGTHALLAKPVVTSAIYPCMVMAVEMHRQRLAAVRQIADLEERIRLRPLVHSAVRSLMSTAAIDESQAYDLLRATAMRRRMTLEHVAADLLAGHNPVAEAG